MKRDTMILFGTLAAVYGASMFQVTPWGAPVQLGIIASASIWHWINARKIDQSDSISKKIEAMDNDLKSLRSALALRQQSGKTFP